MKVAEMLIESVSILGWMDDLGFYLIFNSISVTSGQWAVDNGGCVQRNPI